MVQQLASAEQFQDAITDSNFKATIVDFTATWCGPCQMIKVKYQCNLNERVSPFLNTFYYSNVNSHFSKSCLKRTQT